MNFSWKQIAAQQKANLGVAFGVADVVFDSAERLGNLNMEAMNSLIKDAQDNVIRSALPRLPFDVLLPPSFPPLFFIEKTQSYGRKVYDIAAGAQAEIADVVRSRCDTYRDWFSDEGSKGSAPPAESAVVVWKAAIEAGNAFSETIQKAGLQALQGRGHQPRRDDGRNGQGCAASDRGGVVQRSALRQQGLREPPLRLAQPRRSTCVFRYPRRLPRVCPFRYAVSTRRAPRCRSHRARIAGGVRTPEHARRRRADRGCAR